MEKDQKEREIMNHFSHPHALVLNEEKSDQSTEEARCCRGCLEPLFGPCFSCEECSEFHLHKKCAQAPLQINHSFHRKHPILTLKSSIHVYCDLCKQRGDMFSYWCSFDGCDACLDIKCAFLLHNIDGNFRELKYVGHQHPLTFFESPINDELKHALCYWCQKPLVDSVYVCLDCRFYLHKKCAQLPTQLSYPSHRKHHLFIEDGCFVCNLCESEDWSLCYRCLPCEFNIDIKCVLSKARFTNIVDSSDHEHQFTELIINGSFVCDACGTEGNYISYICSSCHIMIHEKCISLPRFIKITRHHHNMAHNYFFQKKELENHDCGICLSEVKAEYGSYNCLKPDCNHVVHVNCAIEDKNLFRVIDPDNQDETDENSESSITRILEVNERGDAVKIEHFSHQHCLMLGDKINGDDDDEQCDGCVGYILDNSFYYCSKCDFILHKTCAELPRRKVLWFLQSLTTLDSGEIFICIRCHRLCNGFSYSDEDNDENFCLRCATISHTLRCDGHEHPLFFDFNFRRNCNACGDTCHYGAFKCKDHCSYALHFRCITQPQETWHKSCDEHLLKLAFVDQHKDDDDEEQYYCDICEEKRDPNLWFYYCEHCDKSVHPKCALGKYPFIKNKIGTTFPSEFHLHRWNHSLIFVKASYETCSICDRPCIEVALQCTDPTCNYIIHLDHCRYSF